MTPLSVSSNQSPGSVMASSLLFENAFDAILIVEAEKGIICQANLQAEKLVGLGAAQLLGTPVEQLFTEESQAYHRGLFHKACEGDSVLGEADLLVQGQGARPVEVAYVRSDEAGQKLLVLQIRDLFDRKRGEKERALMAARRQEAQRLDSLNVLVGGVAHDFNNILMSILGYAIMGRDKSAQVPVVKQYFSQIEGSTIKAGELCRKMLAFAGRGEVSLRQGNLNELIRDVEASLRDNIGNKAVFDLSVAPNLAPTLFDPCKLTQVIFCLMQNALEALDREERRILLRTYFSPLVDPRRSEGFVSPDLPRGDCQVIEVVDNGCGISPERVSRIFEPFFSTKFIGRGLGLSEALGTIRAHRGAIQVVSTFGRGSSFRIYLPVQGALDLASRTNSAPPFLSSAVQRSLALVVEDLDANREYVVQLLKDNGYSVRSASTSTEALRCLESSGTRLTLVILDLSLPEIPGQELLRRIRMSKHKDMRVIIMSGHSKEESYERCYPFRPDGFLPKPFSAEDLRKAIA